MRNNTVLTTQFCFIDGKNLTKKFVFGNSLLNFAISLKIFADIPKMHFSVNPQVITLSFYGRFCAIHNKVTKTKVWKL
jgi:hypothetical protein